MFLPRDQKCLSQLGVGRCSKPPLRAPWGCPTYTCKVLSLWQGEIHPKEVPLQQMKDETCLRIPLVYPRWGSSWTCPIRCSRPGKSLTRCALLLLLFLGILQQWLWPSPTSDPGRRLLLGGPQGTRLGHGRVAGVPQPCWTLALVVFPSPGQDESAVKSCLTSPTLHFREYQMCSPARTGFAFCPRGLQANKPNLLLWRAWPWQVTALPHRGKCGSPSSARSGCNALTGRA